MESDRISSAQRVAVVAGATGLVGSELVQRLLAEPRYRLLIALVRRPLPLTSPRLVVAEANFEQLDQTLALATAEAAPHRRLLLPRHDD
jgi:uncharacterized protein YbjT (DUF2867 family)